MSTLMEDRLTAALRARAEQVQPEHLRRADVAPVRGRDRGRRTGVVAGMVGLAVAASVAAVAGPLLTGGPGPDERPQPAGPTEPGPTSSTQRPPGGIAVDVDGDGRTDTARVVEEAGEHRLVVDLGSGDRVAVPLRETEQGVVLTAGDLGGLPGDELVVPVGDDPGELPAVFTWRDQWGPVRATYPDDTLESLDVPLQEPYVRPVELLWALDKGVLRTWDADAPGDGTNVAFWDWSVDDRARLRPGDLRRGCVPEGGTMPEPCPAAPSGGSDAGPDGDLPVLMPAVEERLTDERYFYGRGPAAGDYAQLRGDLGEEGGAVDDGQVELVVTALGVEHRVPVTGGQTPWLVPQVLVAGDAPLFAIVRSGGDTAVVELFTFWNGELIQVEPTGDVFLGSGVVEYQGELTEQRTWLTPEGRMFTSVLLDWATRRQHLWEWRDDREAETIAPTDLGEACIDWEAGTYERC